MQFDRRQRKLRRAVAGGVILAAVSAIPLFLFELSYLLAVRHPGFDSGYDGFIYCQTLLAVPLALLTVLGVAQGLVMLGVSTLTGWLAARRVAEPRWMGLLYSLLFAPAIAVAAARMFAGRRALQIPGKDLLAIGIGLAGVVACYGLARLAIAVRDRFRLRRWGPAQARLIAPALLLLAVVTYLADQRILPRLYPFFHVGLTVATIIICQLAVATVYAAWRPRARWIGRMIDPGLSLLLLVAIVGWGAWGLRRVSRSEQFRFLAHQHTVVQSKMLDLTARVGLTMTRAEILPQLVNDPLPPDARTVAKGPRVPEANLLLISVDALRADHMGIYGYKRPTTPQLDRWAKDAVVFERGYCSMPHTSFSLTSLMCGKHVYSAGGGQHVTISTVLRRYGFNTAGFFPPAVFYTDGDRFAAYRESKFDFEYVKFEFLAAEKRVDQIFEFLRSYEAAQRQAAGERRRFFIWAHFFEPHEPYVFRPDHDFGRRAVDRYDGEVAYVDRHLGRLIAGVRKRYPKTIVAVTGDHGEAFGEHGSYYHGNSLYEEQIRVPALIGVPGVAGRRLAGAAQTVDLVVTMLALADIPVPASMSGRDLSPWFDGNEPSALPPAYVEIDQMKAVIHGDQKLIKDDIRGFRELYRLKSDPGELDNAVGRAPKLAARLERRLARWTGRRRGGGQRGSSVDRLLARARKRDPGAVPGLIRLLSGSVDERRRAVEALVGLRVQRARKALARLLTDRDPEVKMRATIGVALLGDGKQLPALDRVLARADLPPAMRRDALIAKARLGDRTTGAELGRILDRTESIYQRVELIEVLGDLGADGVERSIRGQLKTLRTRRYAIKALGKLRARSAVPELIKSLRSDRFISWRAAAARALGQIGDRRAVADLQHVVRYELEGGVVSWSLDALGRIDALQIPGVRSLAPLAWRCEGDVCRMPLGRGGRARCDQLPARELLVLLAEAKPTVVKVYCGDRRVGALEIQGTAAAGSGRDKPSVAAAVVVSLAGGEGALRLQAGAPAPAVRFAGTRSLTILAADRGSPVGGGK